MTQAASRRKFQVTAVLAAMMLAGCGVGDPDPPTPQPTTGTDGLHIAIPAYVDPKDSIFWQSVVDSAPQVGDIIVNPNNGPGATASERHVQLIRTLREAGVRVLGYVMTGWGERDAAAVAQDMDRWRDWYGVDDIFLDEAASVSEEVDTYADYVESVHEAGGIAVLNPGLLPDRGYFEFADAIVTFEDPMANCPRAGS